MIAVSLRGLLTRKLRTVLTMIAIVLGVSMISGTYVLTDAINNSFTQIFQTADRKIDAVVTAKAVVSSDFSTPPPLPSSLLNVVRATPGVAVAEGEVADVAQLFDRHGNRLSSTTGAPTLLVSVPSARFRSSTIIRGHDPHGNEFTIDESTFLRRHLRLGQVVGIAAAQQVQRFTLVGVLRFGSIGSLGGATLVSVDLSTAQRITDKIGKFDQISVAADSGVSKQELVRRILARIPPASRAHLTVKTSVQAATDQAATIANALQFLTIALLAFGGIAVFVGAFIIFNTFSITVAQRAREFALLRTLGSTRAQILLSVISEAFSIGITASLIGLLAGLGIAKGLGSLFIAFGIDLPNSGLQIQVRTVVVAILVGTIVTLVSGLNPAIRATRVAPIAALQEGAHVPRSRWARYTPYVATVLAALGILGLVAGIFASLSSTSLRLSLIGLGAVALFLGVAMFSPQIVVPLAAVIGWPIERCTAITGRLARENAVRNPSRTAVTAAALMIGLALVGFVTIFAAELSKTANDAINRELAGTYVVYSSQSLIPAGTAGVIARVRGVQSVSSVKSDRGRYTGIGTQSTAGIQPANFGTVYRFQWTQGSNSTLTALPPHGALISDALQNDHHLAVGSTLRVTTPSGRQDRFTVTGIFKSNQFLGAIAIRYDTFTHDWQQQMVRFVIVQAASGANTKALQKRIEHALLTRYPTATVYSQQDIKNQQSQNVNKLLYLIYVLLAMSVLVSLFGIINTLVLSVYERTREIGMLRAIGTSRRQIRWIIRWEAVITSVIGALLGLLLGIVLAVLITAGLQSQGIEYALPVIRLLIWVGFAIVFGIVAAAFPARRAARLDVLRAVAYE